MWEGNLENELCNVDYRKHLDENLSLKEITAIKQAGKSDLEDDNYIQNVRSWYSQLKSYIENHPPIKYVKELRVFENDSRIIDSVEYHYYQENEVIDEVTLCIIRL